MKKLFIILLSVLALTAFAQQKKVAVYVIGEDDGVNKVLGSKLVSAIARSEEFTAIERTSAFLAELNKEQNYQRTGAVDDNEISRLGKQFGVQYVCVATITEAFDEKYLSARLIDVESAQVERSASSSAAIQSLESLVSAANTVSDNLLANLGKGKQFNSKKVAVYVVKNDTRKEIGRVLADKLVAGFANSGRYIAIERTNSFLTQLSKEQNYQQSGAVNDNDLSRLGKQFGVDYVCIADVSDVFGEIFVSARLIDVETAEVVNGYDAGGAMNTMNNCLKVANEIAANLSIGTFKEQVEEAKIKAKEEARLKAEQEAKALEAQRKAEEEEKKRREAQKMQELTNMGYVDLGLPSGTWWKSRPESTAQTTFSNVNKRYLPSRQQAEELINSCTWERSGYSLIAIGPNGNRISFPSTTSYKEWGKYYYLGYYFTNETKCVMFIGSTANKPSILNDWKYNAAVRYVIIP